MHQKPNGRCNKYQYRGRLAACHKHQTRMKETPARGPERHYEGVGGTQRDPCSIKKGNTYRIPFSVETVGLEPTTFPQNSCWLTAFRHICKAGRDGRSSDT